MERLTEKHGNEYLADIYDDEEDDGGLGHQIPLDSIKVKGLIQKLGKYEDLEEQGLLLKLPCKVGDTVFCIHMYSGGGRVSDWGEMFLSNFSISMYDDFGKTVFLTQAEAEKALANMKEVAD